MTKKPVNAAEKLPVEREIDVRFQDAFLQKHDTIFHPVGDACRLELSREEALQRAKEDLLLRELLELEERDRKEIEQQ